MLSVHACLILTTCGYEELWVQALCVYSRALSGRLRPHYTVTLSSCIAPRFHYYTTFIKANWFGMLENAIPLQGALQGQLKPVWMNTFNKRYCIFYLVFKRNSSGQKKESKRQLSGDHSDSWHGVWARSAPPVVWTIRDGKQNSHRRPIPSALHFLAPPRPIKPPVKLRRCLALITTARTTNPLEIWSKSHYFYRSKRTSSPRNGVPFE